MARVREDDDDGQLNLIIADLEEYTRLEIVALSMNMVANLQEQPPIGTPVDTGWARNNWLPSVGEPKIMDADKKDPTPADVAARGKVSQAGTNDVLAWKNGDGPIFATNNVPYIRALNAGHSKQSPAGFVQAALERAVRQTAASADRKRGRNTRASAARAAKPRRSQP